MRWQKVTNYFKITYLDRREILPNHKDFGNWILLHLRRNSIQNKSRPIDTPEYESHYEACSGAKAHPDESSTLRLPEDKYGG